MADRLPQGSLVHFTDAQWGMSTSQRSLLSQLAKDRGRFPFVFWGNIRSNVVTPEIIDALYAAGFRCLGLGLESLYDPALNAVSKHCTTHQHLTACQMIKDRYQDLFLKAYVIIGLPSETPSSLEATNESLRTMLKHGLVDQLTVFMLVPYPGSAMFRNPAKYGLTIVTYDWRFYQDRSYPPIIRYDQLIEDEIYTAFLETNRIELEFLRQVYPGK